MPDTPHDPAAPGGPADPADPFGTAGIRARVLRAWAEAPARFREDANAEEDYALGGYRDRVIVELAQNAADAAARTATPGRLRFTLAGGMLEAANTGAPLDADGVAGLSTLRASAKRDHVTGTPGGPAGPDPADQEAGTEPAAGDGEPAAYGPVGRFGVGFAAVAAVSDEPVIVSTTGAVMWSARRARGDVAAIPELTDELSRRGGAVPLLRLPYAVPGGAAGAAESAPEVPAGYDTVVRLPLRDDAAVRQVERLLAEIGPSLLLALPALDEVVVDAGGAVRTLTAERPGPGECLITTEAARAAPGGARTRTAAPEEAAPARAAPEAAAPQGTPAGRTTVRWRTVTAGGRVAAELLADRPTEERSRPWWQVRWAIPLDADGMPAPLPDTVPAVLHAPTPSAEPLDLPALLLAGFPLAPDRRHVAPGPLADFLVDQAADAYVRLVRGLAGDRHEPESGRTTGGAIGRQVLDLVPGPVAAGELDARIRRGVRAALPGVPLLPAAAADADLLPGRDAVVLDGGPDLVKPLAEVLPGLVAAGWPVRHPALGALGVRTVEPAEAVDALAGVERPPRWWRGLYDALAGVDPQALGALPVPLADGRTVRGPRGVLIATDGVDPARLARLGLRFAHAEAAHPLLRRLGAADAGPEAILRDPAVRAAVAASFDEFEAFEEMGEAEPGGTPGTASGSETMNGQGVELGRVAAAVLPLVAAAGIPPGALPWLADLALPGTDGEIYPAGELLLPDSPLRAVMAEDAPFGVVHPVLAERFGADVLEAVGVLRTFAVLRAADVMLGDAAMTDAEVRSPAHRAGAAAPEPGEEPDQDDWRQLDDVEAWADGLIARMPDGGAPVVPEFVAIRDLELVADDRWPEALRLLARPPLRAAVTEPATMLGPGGRRIEIPSYTSWWLREHALLGGRPPGDLRLPDTDPLLAGLYDPAPTDVDTELARALGVRTSLAAVLAEPAGPDDVLTRLGDPERHVERERLRALWTALAEVDPARVAPPERIRAVVDGAVEVVSAGDALVVDAPDLLPALAGQPLVLAPIPLAGRLAELLEVPLAGEEVPGVVESASAGRSRQVPDLVRALLPDAPDTYLAYEADRLIVDGRPARWRFIDGVVHAADLGGLARGLAWACGRWDRRLAVEAALRDPDGISGLRDEADLES